MIRKGIIPLLATGHGINDLMAGFFLGSIAQQGADITQAGMALLLYNLLAFGGQYPFALWMEKYKNNKAFLIVSFGLNVLAAAVFINVPSLSVVFAGIASAIYHVAGGAVCAGNNKAANIGLFAAPGVAGLIAGGYFAWAGYKLSMLLLVISCLFLLVLYLLQVPDKDYGNRTKPLPVSAVPDRHDTVMILLLSVIALRSAVWNIFQLIHENNYEWLIAVAASAFAGKIAGGWIADRAGWKLYIFISLFTATPLITFFRNELILFCIGIGLLQSGIPATTAMLIESVKGKTERGIGLSFGAAIILGGITFTIPARFFTQSVFFPAFIILLVLLLLLLATRRRYPYPGQSEIIRNGQ